MSSKQLLEGMRLAREGNLDAALQFLRENGGERDENALAMMYMVTRVTDDKKHAMDLCEQALLLVETPIQISTWTLRRGLLRIELDDRKGSIYDLTKVISLQASDDQVKQAQSALLAIA
ncbi:MAG: hypothetical protein GY822_05555 [Deltaproteobacteria bacterium]|nr:hypothetical protein [Deltaproteobacteria bacterium]